MSHGSKKWEEPKKVIRVGKISGKYDIITVEEER